MLSPEAEEKVRRVISMWEGGVNDVLGNGGGGVPDLPDDEPDADDKGGPSDNDADDASPVYGTSGLGRMHGTSGLGAEQGPEYRPDEVDGPMFGTSGLGAEQGPEYRPEALRQRSPRPDWVNQQVESEQPAASPSASGQAVAGSGARNSRVPAVADPKPSPESLDWKDLADRLGWGQIGRNDSRAYENLFANVGAQAGYKPNAHAGDVLVESAKLPLDMAKEKQGYESRDLAMEGQRQAMADKKAAAGVKAAMDDPNSLQSQKAREAVKSFFEGQRLPTGFDNWSANDVQRYANSGTLAKLADDRRAVETAKAKAAAGEEKAKAEEAALQNTRKALAKELIAAGFDPTTATKDDIKTMLQLRGQNISNENADATRALARAASARADAPKLPPGQLAEVADYETAAKAADGLLADYEAAGLDGLGSKIGGKVSDATGIDMGAVSQYNDKANTAAQTIGLALEGGKLGEADLPRYKAMLPQPGDSPERARAKRDNLKRALADKAAGRSIEWLKAGYKVPEPSGKTGGGKIRVRRKADGKTGSLLESDFDGSKYERL